jgi:melibiose permease
MFISGQTLQSFTLFLIFGVVGCAGIGAMFVAQTAMLADVVDYGEAKTGARTDSVVFSMKSLLLKAAYAIQSLIIGAGLKLAQYDGELSAQSAGTKNGIAVMMFAIPPLFVLGSFIVFRAKYKLDGAKMDEVRDRIAEITSIPTPQDAALERKQIEE